MRGLRRKLLQALGAGAALAMAGCARSAGGVPVYKISAGQLQQALAARFPLRRSFGGALALELRTPVLSLLPERNRIGADVSFGASGSALQRAYNGSFALEFGLRYEASDRSLRAHQLELRSLDLPELPAQALALLQAALPQVLRQTVGEVVLHTLRPQDLALADSLGLQPGAITVTRQGLEIAFSAQPPP
jgi:hypothetical protein